MKSYTVAGMILLPFLFVLCVALTKADDSNSELLDAAATGDISRVVRSLDQGANIETRNEAGATPLMWAAVNDHVAVVWLLIQRGANVNAKTDSGATALKGAAVQGHLEVVQALQRAGAEVNAKDNHGQNALDAARAAGQNAIVVFLENVMRQSGVVNSTGAISASGQKEAIVIRVDQPEQCLRIREGPGSNYQKVGCASMREKIKLTGIVSNGWAEVQDPARGWVTVSQIRAKGLVPEQTSNSVDKISKKVL